MEANLSRLHTLINQTYTDIGRLLDRAEKSLAANGGNFAFQILESSTDADLREFLKRLGAKKELNERIFRECRLLLEYSFYLRRELDAANRSAGVAEKLLEQSNVKKKLAQLYRLRQIISISCSQGLTEIKTADYYKASFTENSREYTLYAQMFSEDDYSDILEEIERAEKESFAIGNEIAYLNQTTIISVKSFEEFSN